MKTTKIIAAGCLALLAAGNASFAEDASSSSFFAEAPASGDSSPLALAANALSIGGTAWIGARAGISEDSIRAMNSESDFADSVDADPSLTLNLSWKGSSSELEGTVLLDTDTLGPNRYGVIDEFAARAFAGDFVVEAGKMKVVWGRGDKLHVTDVFNANDYSDFIIPDYIDRRIAEPMARVAWNGQSGIRVEAIWTPTMTADRVPTEGIWAPSQAKNLASLGAEYVKGLASSAYGSAYGSTYASTANGLSAKVYSLAFAKAKAQGATDALAATAASNAVTAKAEDIKVASQAAASGAALLAAQGVSSNYASAADLLPNVKTLDYGQYGLRVTGTVGVADIGAQYYFGHYKTPSWTVAYGTDSLGKTVVSGLSLDYDRLQVFAVDGACAVGILNLRAEGAYYLTDDVAGTDPSVRNNSAQWLAGFDADLPVHNLNLNVQTIGVMVQKSGEIANSRDVDWNDAEKWTNNKLVVNVSDTFNHEKVKGEVTALWGIERQDLVVQPKLTCSVSDGMSVILSGAIFASDDDGEFAVYKDNDFAQLAVKYSF